MRNVGRLLPVLFGIALCWLLSGAWGDRGGRPQLLQLSEVGPREVELGDRIEIAGEGFPTGRPARITFRGALHRPGERPELDVEIEADGAVANPRRVDLAVTEAVLSRFCRAGDRTAHTTFAGQVEVAFAPAVAGAAPVAGSLERVSLDLRPSRAGADREPAAARLLAWIGVDAAPTPSGLLVSSVRSGSPAAMAGLAAQDVITSFDGLRAVTAGDALPAPGAREMVLGARRDGVESEHTVAVDGFRREAPVELLAAMLVALAVLGAILLFAAPSAPIGAAALARAATRLRASRGVLEATIAETLPPGSALAMVDVVAFALLASMPFGQYLVAAQIDVGLLFTLAVTSLATAALVANGSAASGVRAAAAVVAQHAPAALAVVAVVTVTGSLRVREIEAAQGAMPWDWLAFRSPGALVACATLLLAARIEPVAAPAPAGLAGLVEDGAAAPKLAPWLAAVCRAHHVVVAGLACALFLGGWLLPGLTAAEQDARPGLEIVGAVWFLAKIGALVALAAWSREAFPRGRLRESTRAAALWLAPASAVALAAVAAWSWWGPTPAAQRLTSAALLTMAALVAAAVAHRIRYGMTAQAAEGRVSPFL